MRKSWTVRTRDGGAVEVWLQGSGPPLVMVHGSMCDHSTFGPLMEELRDDATMFALDRRGFGGSADGPGYSADREFGDVAAVVDAVAQRVGRTVTLFGHSWGASCALGAARLTDQVGRLVLYEPSLGLRYPPGVIDTVEALVAARDYEAAVVRVLVQVAGMADDEVQALRSVPAWHDRVATAPTIAREARIEEGWEWKPDQFGSIQVPTLLITGSECPDELAVITQRTAEAVSGARVHVLRGHGHFAYRFAPAVVADVLRRWLA